MKKLIATLICLVVLSMTALPVAAQRRSRWNNRPVYNTRNDNRYNNRSVYNSRYDSRYDNNVYRNDDYRYGRERSVWDKHRDKITTAGGAVGGALLGGLIGGKKGAIIGAITGGAGAAVYTYKVRDKNRRY
jgi:outer membrane lipoprotein SlyB